MIMVLKGTIAKYTIGLNIIIKQMNVINIQIDM